MKALLAFLLALWCGSEDGVEVEINVRGEPQRTKINVLCHEPEVRIPVYRSEVGSHRDNSLSEEVR